MTAAPPGPALQNWSCLRRPRPQVPPGSTAALTVGQLVVPTLRRRSAPHIKAVNRPRCTAPTTGRNYVRIGHDLALCTGYSALNNVLAPWQKTARCSKQMCRVSRNFYACVFAQYDGRKPNLQSIFKRKPRPEYSVSPNLSREFCGIHYIRDQ